MYSSNKSCRSDGKRCPILLSSIIRLIPDNSTSLLENKCDSYLLFQFETNVGSGTRTFLYILGLAYCFIGLSAITARFFRSMGNVVKQTREIVCVDPGTGAKVVRRERIWNYTLADISLLAFGTSFPQISLSTIDAFQNLGQRYAGGLFFTFVITLNFSNLSSFPLT
jgi:magnesium/proton exchanger